MIEFQEIEDLEFESFIVKFDECIKLLKSNFHIELKTYGIFLRVLLNNIQTYSLTNLIERINVNRELENALDNFGGYNTDILELNNPKLILLDLVNYLYLNPLKNKKLIETLNITKIPKNVIADTNDIDFLKEKIANKSIKFTSHTQLKKIIVQKCDLIYYSFNGKKDFDFIYNYKGNVLLLIYKQENQLYKYQFQKYKHLIEEEVCSIERESICDIHYDPIPDVPIDVSKTIENIVNRIDDMSNKAYENYKEEADTLLENIEEKIVYKTSFNNGTIEYLDSNDSVFNADGDLLKIYRLKVEDKIRIYPREQFAEKLYQVAVDTEESVFSKVEEDSKYWQVVLTELKLLYPSKLYSKLKENGLRVLPGTVESYLNGQRKFPMFNNDMKAIFKLRFLEKEELEIEKLLLPIRKSKSTYNSTMIALGRGIKQEIKLFLKEQRIGEILTKLNFSSTTLNAFIEEFMPLLVILEKEIYQDEAGQFEFNFNQDIEL